MELYHVGFVAIVFCAFGVTAQDFQSPCPRLFVYERKGNESEKLYGIITLLSPTDLSGVWFRLILDRPSLQLGNWFGEVVTHDNKEYLIKNRNYKLQANVPKSVSFFIKYNLNEPVPRLTSFRLNAKIICPEGVTIAPPFVGELMTSGEYVTTPRPSGFGSKSTSQDRTLATRTSNEKCGSVPLKGKPLVYNGKKSEEGRWPWHLAIHRITGSLLEYSCGGTLISDRFAVTAAHCVVNMPGKTILNPQLLLIQVGTNELKDGGVGLQNIQPSEIFIHSNFDPQRYYNDIALIKFTRKVLFTDFVQSVCLWEGNTDQSTVVGWGVDDNNVTSTELKEIKIPVVGLSTCIYSNREFYSEYTSETSYYAGFTNGTTVCPGDSGSRMVFPKPGNPGKEIWQIRGIVSVSPNPGTRACATDSYVVFTDVAKHLSWIKSTANLS